MNLLTCFDLSGGEAPNRLAFLTEINGMSFALCDNYTDRYTAVCSIKLSEFYEAFCRITVDFSKTSISFAVSLMDHLGPYCLASKDHRLMGCRYSLLFNSKNIPKMCVSPLNG